MSQVPAIIPPNALATTIGPDLHLVPVLIADAGDAAGWRYVEFFTANIGNPHTRRAYARACSRFFAWCETRGLTLTTIRPHDVATYIKALQETHSAPAVKQQLAAVRMLFDWLIIGQVASSNPASAVRGPKHMSSRSFSAGPLGCGRPGSSAPGAGAGGAARSPAAGSAAAPLGGGGLTWSAPGGWTCGRGTGVRNVVNAARFSNDFESWPGRSARASWGHRGAAAIGLLGPATP